MAADKSHSDLVLEKIRDVLSDDNYGFATAVVTYCETMSLTLNYIGMSEFRDALTHIQRVVNAENETIVAEELNSAYEHIRRAAVESYQDYVEKQFFDLERRIKSPLLYLYKVSYTHDWKNIKKSEDIIKQNISCAREAKPRKEWREAINYFMNADKEITKLNDIIPPYSELNKRFSIWVVIIFTIILLILSFNGGIRLS